MDLRLYMAQRLSALLMAPFVLVHLGGMIYVIQSGLSAQDILGRTQGSLPWMLFYGGFVVTAGVHGAIGLRTIAQEWFGLRGRALSLLGWAVGLGLITLGLRAVFAVTVAGPA